MARLPGSKPASSCPASAKANEKARIEDDAQLPCLASLQTLLPVWSQVRLRNWGHDGGAAVPFSDRFFFLNSGVCYCRRWSKKKKESAGVVCLCSGGSGWDEAWKRARDFLLLTKSFFPALLTRPGFFLSTQFCMSLSTTTTTAIESFIFLFFNRNSLQFSFYVPFFMCTLNTAFLSN